MLIRGEVITTSGFCGSYFGTPNRPNWTGYIGKHVWELKCGRNVNYRRNYNYFRFFRSHIGSPKKSYWSGHGRKRA